MLPRCSTADAGYREAAHVDAEFVQRDRPRELPVPAHLRRPGRHAAAHVKSSLLGSSLLIPVEIGRLHLGTWQGISLCEHRNHGGARSLILTLQGDRAA